MSESICVSKSLDMYVWIIKAQCDMEKCYNIKMLRIIVGDGFLQKLLITSLADTKIFTLRCN